MKSSFKMLKYAIVALGVGIASTVLVPEEKTLAGEGISPVKIEASGKHGIGETHRFRGLNGTGVYDATNLSFPWDPASERRVQLPGGGNGSPVVYEGRIYVQAADSEDATRYLIAIRQSDGKEMWRRTFESKSHTLHKFSSYASSTPCVDSKHVYAAWADPDHTYLKAFTHDGEEVWSRDFGTYRSEHGFGTSPILVDERVVLLNSQDLPEPDAGGANSSQTSQAPVSDRVIAVRADSGLTDWEANVPASKVCYGVPCVWEGARDGKRVTELLCCTTTQGIFAIDSNDGKVLWNHDCFTQRVCSSPLVAQDVVIATHGSGGGRDNMLVAFDLKTKAERFRVKRSAPYVPSPVAKENTLFLWGDAGVVTAVNLLDGTVYWTKRIGGDYSSSPIVAGEFVLNVSHNGVVHVLEADRQFHKVAEIDTEMVVRSTPVISAGSLIVRGDDQLLIVPLIGER